LSAPGRGQTVEPEAIGIGAGMAEPRQLDHRLGQPLVERAVPVGVVFVGELLQADPLHLVDLRRAERWCLGVAPVPEGRQDVGILVTIQAVGG
jgi:hypothetical protein